MSFVDGSEVVWIIPRLERWSFHRSLLAEVAPRQVAFRGFTRSWAKGFGLLFSFCFQNGRELREVFFEVHHWWLGMIEGSESASKFLNFRIFPFLF